jgi:hypothetical protein
MVFQEIRLLLEVDCVHDLRMLPLSVREHNFFFPRPKVG